MAGEKLCFKRSITLTWKDFLLQKLGSSVVEITSLVYTETITLFDLRDRSRIFTSISKNNCQLSACFFAYFFWLEATFPIIYSFTFVDIQDGAIDIDYFRFVQEAAFT